MNRSNFALFVALLIHFFLMLIFWILGSILSEIKQEKKPEEKKIKISLKELPKKKEIKAANRVENIPLPEIAPPMIKGSQLKEIAKSTPIQYEEKAQPIVPKLNPQPMKETKAKSIKEPLVSITKEELIPLRKEIKETEELPTKEITKKENQMSWLYEDNTKFEQAEEKIERTSSTSAGKNIRELYGSKFGELSKAQQEYILDNQEIMRRITQQVLTRQASVSDLRGLNVNKINVIEFYLHPNGDMSDFKFLQESGYFILDEITKVTIEYAYSKYPRPKEKTLIRYNVFYNLISH